MATMAAAHPNFVAIDWNGTVVPFFGLPALTRFNLKGFDEKLLKTFLSQEFLKRGILGSDTIYVSVAHTKKILNKYIIDTKGILA